MVTKEVLGGFAENFFKAEKLIDDSKFDPATEPFLSKYAARQILLELFDEIRAIAESGINSDPSYSRILGMEAACHLKLAIIAFDVDEMSIGESHLQICENVVHFHEDSAECAGITLMLYNEYGIYHHTIDSPKDVEYLSKAERFYNNCKLTNLNILSISDLFTDENSGEGNMKFEATYTLTLYILAQVYAESNPLKSAIYCHQTLKRQLNAQDDAFDNIDWSLNAATLAQYFISQNCFKQARHHLAVSSRVLYEYELKLDRILEETEETDAKREQYKHRSADINRCWAKYCYCLLISSKERLMADTLIDIAATDLSIMDFYENDKQITKSDTKKLCFENVDTNSYESIVTDKYICVYTEAKPIFMIALDFLNKAQEYYSLDNMASDYIEIVQEQAKLYSLALTFFEENSDNCAKLYKRAIDLLEVVLTQVNSKYYLKYCQEIWHRLGQLYSKILDIKLEKRNISTERPTPDALRKINKLIDKSIFYFQTYIDSLPKDLVESSVEPFLISHFDIAALTRKYIIYDKKAKLLNAKNSLTHFDLVLNYCNEHDNAKIIISEYIPIAKELVVLLQVEIKRLEREIGPLE